MKESANHRQDLASRTLEVRATPKMNFVKLPSAVAEREMALVGGGGGGGGG